VNFEHICYHDRLSVLIVRPVFSALFTAPLSQISDHYDYFTPLFVDHAPKITDCVFQGALSCDEDFLIIVALKRRLVNSN
jgi:hypothetical protein